MEVDRLRFLIPGPGHRREGAVELGLEIGIGEGHAADLIQRQLANPGSGHQRQERHDDGLLVANNLGSRFDAEDGTADLFGLPRDLDRGSAQLAEELGDARTATEIDLEAAQGLLQRILAGIDDGAD